MAITFDKSAKNILIATTDVVTSVQEIADAIRTFEALLNNLDLPTMMIATGKDALGGGNFTGITLVLQDGWKIKVNGVPAGETQFTINEGNFTTSDGSSPTVFGTNVKWEIQQSTSPTLVVGAGQSTGTRRSMNV